MPQYTREQIYEAMRRADAAGDGDAVRALAAQLQTMSAPEQAGGFGRARSTPAEPTSARASVATTGAQTGERAARGRPAPPPEAPTWMHSAAPTPFGQAMAPLVEQALNTRQGQDFQRGTGSMAEGMTNYTIGLAANPVGQMMYNAMGVDQPYNSGEIVRGALGLNRVEDPIAHEAIAGAGGALLGTGLANWVARTAGGVTSNALAPLFATPVRDTVAGGAAGAAIAATEDQGPVVQTLAGLGAGLTGHYAAGVPGRLRGGTVVASTTPEQQAIRFGEENGVRVMTSDVRPPQTPIGVGARLAGESIPFVGTGGARVRQQQGRERLVRELAEDYGIGAGGEDYLAAVSENLTATRAGRLQSYTNTKNQVIDGITDPVVSLPNTMQAIDDGIARLRSYDPEEYAPVIDRLQRFRDRLNSGLTLRQVEEQRRLLGDMFADPNLANIRGRGEQVINSVYGPLRQDMGDFIEASAGRGEMERWQRANNSLAAMAGELDVSTFRNVLTNADATPEGVARLLFSRRPSDVQRLMQNLGPRGQENARSAIVYEILRRSGSDSELRNISPTRVVNTMRQMGGTIGVAFDGAEAARLQGLERFLDMTRRAQEVSVSPPTGARNYLPIGGAVLADLMGGLGGATATATLMGAMANAYESAAVRNALLRLGRQEPNSRAAMNTTIQVMRIMQAEGFLNAVNDNTAVISNAVAEEDQQ